MSGEAVCRAGPSLALIKYWGKSVKGDNLPATPSLAVTLGGVHSEARVRAGFRQEFPEIPQTVVYRSGEPSDWDDLKALGHRLFRQETPSRPSGALRRRSREGGKPVILNRSGLAPSRE